MDIFLTASKSANTWKKYNAAKTKFVEWCAANKVGAFPASSWNVLCYLSKTAISTESVSTVVTASAAISAAHKMGGCYPPASCDPWVGALCEGIRRTFSKPVVQKKPITPEMIKEILVLNLGKKLSGGSIKQWRNAWVIFFLFRACARFGESARLTLADFSRAPSVSFLSLQEE